MTVCRGYGMIQQLSIIVFSIVTVPDVFDRYIIIKVKVYLFFQIFMILLAVIFGTVPILTLFYKML